MNSKLPKTFSFVFLTLIAKVPIKKGTFKGNYVGPEGWQRTAGDSSAGGRFQTIPPSTPWIFGFDMHTLQIKNMGVPFFSWILDPRPTPPFFFKRIPTLWGRLFWTYFFFMKNDSKNNFSDLGVPPPLGLVHTSQTYAQVVGESWFSEPLCIRLLARVFWKQFPPFPPPSWPWSYTKNKLERTCWQSVRLFYPCWHAVRLFYPCWHAVVYFRYQLDNWVIGALL